MAGKAQTISNHTRRDPLFHFFLIPGLLLFLIWAVVHSIRHLQPLSLALVAMAVFVIVLTLKARLYALKVQDRVIRLEERLRLAELLPESVRGRIGELTESQLIALRFAPDKEIPELVQRALNEQLAGKQIKEAVREWRPDNWRV